MQYQGVVVYSMADVPLVSSLNGDADEDVSSHPVLYFGQPGARSFIVAAPACCFCTVAAALLLFNVSLSSFLSVLRLSLSLGFWCGSKVHAGLSAS